MSTNPFDMIIERIDRMQLDLTKKIEDTYSKPRIEWEGLRYAMRVRRKGKDALMKAVAEGKVRTQRKPARGGKDQWFLNRDDLDRIFPAQ